ncbi:SGNH/GDSL hydrolase family protein [Oricola indica]|jgi:lysophospholipase L1-like esterase|uniref:SGNH/GDSL hydrolase family protein n=1 Tax=Oricola indica TaxID=2872591 RepID=UPI001CBCBE5C|nr:GDSL-type esterase/lipase family protein [Oricola indica]
MPACPITTGMTAAILAVLSLCAPPAHAAGAPDLPPVPQALRDLVESGKSGPRKTVLPLGDSITDMQRTRRAAWGGYRRQMANDHVFAALFRFTGAFGDDLHAVSPSPEPPAMPADQRDHCGWSGATLDGWNGPRTSIIENFRYCLAAGPEPDFVLLHGGTNDLWDPVLRPDAEPPEIRGQRVAERTIELVREILMTTDATVLLAQLIPMTGEARAFDTNVVAYNEALETGIDALRSAPDGGGMWTERVVLVDMHAAILDWTRDAPETALPDGIHPNVWGSRIMARKWLSALYDQYGETAPKR